MNLRPYQQRALDELRAHWRSNPVVALPTGSGKTVLAAHVIRGATARGKNCLFLVHRRELVDQAVSRLRALGLQPGVIMAGVAPTMSRVQVASIQTLARRDSPEADIVIVDEAHHTCAESWSAVLDEYPNALRVGLTATPFRTDGQGLGAFFGHIIAPVTVQQLVDDGTLIAPVVYAPPGPSLDGVRTVAGDYNQGQLAAVMAPLTGDIVEHWKKHALGMRTVCFAVNVAHSKAIVARFEAAGIPAEHIDGKTHRDTRADALRRLAMGDTLVLANCNLVSEGWDLPALDAAILARPTKSLGLHIQQIGRVMRAHPGKSQAVVLDHAGNHHRHGMVTDPIEYSLEGKPARPPVHSHKQCPKCYLIVGVLVSVCPDCGHVFAPNAHPLRPLTEAEGQLVKVEPVDKQAAYVELLRTAWRTGRAVGWARHAYRSRFKTWPRLAALEREHYPCVEHEFEEKVYGGWKRARVCKRCKRTA